MRELEQKLAVLVRNLKGALYERDESFLENMKDHNLAGDAVSRYRFWEWPQGIGLFGLYKLYEKTGDARHLDFLVDFYDQRIAEGLPGKNINTMAPILALSLVAGKTGKQAYRDVCREWAEWAMHGLPRTEENGFQHITSDTANSGELWDDTLMMAVATLAALAALFGDESYRLEVVRQVRVHAKYLRDPATGLWFHGWSFPERGNFARALWGRGNCWITIALPLIMETVALDGADKTFMRNLLADQASALAKTQDASGMWHTLLDDPASYLEASATCGFAYGMLEAEKQQLIGARYRDVALKALPQILGLVDGEGHVSRVSCGTPMGRVSRNFYKEIPYANVPYGTALALLFLLNAQ